MPASGNGRSSRTSERASLALVFHHAVQDEQDNTQVAIARLHALTETGDHSYYRDIAHCMAGIPLPEPSTTVWLDGPGEVRTRWHQLVQDRRTHLTAE
ncbi:hypothetical protein ABZ656_30225 [Streptomyces sp. NPDC007095]|jgi:hypothetical protein|uniref:hypothetical protein n=1 Tax=Streptomyces sp. NPDC007095 TaxID=3154482 RepID=UPI000C70007B